MAGSTREQINLVARHPATREIELLEQDGRQEAADPSTIEAQDSG